MSRLVNSASLSVYILFLRSLALSILAENISFSMCETRNSSFSLLEIMIRFFLFLLSSDG